MQMRRTLTPPPKSKFLEGLGNLALQEVVDAGEIQRVGPYEILFIAGDTAVHLFLLLSGHVKFYRTTRDGNKVQLARLVRGNAFGLGTLLADRTPYIGTAETTSPCELLVWRRAGIRKLAHKYPKLSENALGVVLEYVSHVDRLVDLTRLSAPRRLSRALLHLAKDTGKTIHTGIEIHATNEELAELAHISSFTASRVLNRWERAGVLTKSRGKVFIHTPEQLLAN